MHNTSSYTYTYIYTFIHTSYIKHMLYICYDIHLYIHIHTYIHIPYCVCVTAWLNVLPLSHMSCWYMLSTTRYRADTKLLVSNVGGPGGDGQVCSSIGIYQIIVCEWSCKLVHFIFFKFGKQASQGRLYVCCMDVLTERRLFDMPWPWRRAVPRQRRDGASFIYFPTKKY